MTKEEAQMWYDKLISGKLDCGIPRPDLQQDELDDMLADIHLAVRKFQLYIESEAIRHRIIRTWKGEEL